MAGPIRIGGVGAEHDPRAVLTRLLRNGFGFRAGDGDGEFQDFIARPLAPAGQRELVELQQIGFGVVMRLVDQLKHVREIAPGACLPSAGVEAVHARLHQAKRPRRLGQFDGVVGAVGAFVQRIRAFAHRGLRWCGCAQQGWPYRAERGQSCGAAKELSAGIAHVSSRGWRGGLVVGAGRWVHWCRRPLGGGTQPTDRRFPSPACGRRWCAAPDEGGVGFCLLEASPHPNPRSAPRPLRWRKGVRGAANQWFAACSSHPARGRGALKAQGPKSRCSNNLGAL
ncbi:hypothetical protein D3C81_1343360 [compost metagenome]